MTVSFVAVSINFPLLFLPASSFVLCSKHCKHLFCLQHRALLRASQSPTTTTTTTTAAMEGETLLEPLGLHSRAQMHTCYCLPLPSPSHSTQRPNPFPTFQQTTPATVLPDLGSACGAHKLFGFCHLQRSWLAGPAFNCRRLCSRLGLPPAREHAWRGCMTMWWEVR